jgi:RNA polymerase sigma-70 factor (ECF subfamily)
VTDSALIARAKAGEIEAFGELYRRHLPLIYRYVRSRVGSDREAEDLTEDVFLKSFQALETYIDRGAPFSAYLYRIARNLVVDHYRSQQETYAIDEMDWIEDAEGGIEKELVHRESMHELQRALAAIGPNHQEVIRLRILLEIPTDEVAAWLGKKPSSVRVLLHRALKALRREIEINDARRS